MSAASTIAPTPLSMPRRREPTVIEPERPKSPSKPEEISDHSGAGTPQCMRALARANEVRLARADLKRQISAGRRSVVAVLERLPWEANSMTLGELLCSQRRWGRARSRKLLASTALSEGKRLVTLTERQRRILIRALEAKLGATA